MKMNEQERRAIEEAAKKYSASKTDGKHYRDLQCGFIAGAEFALSELRKPSEDMIQRIEEILNPQFENDVFTWCQIHKAISKLQPIEPVFCPDCGYRVRLSGNGVAEQLCTCHRWPPEQKGTTTAGISTVPSENTNQYTIDDFNMWIQRNGYSITGTVGYYQKGTALESEQSLLMRYHAECQLPAIFGRLNALLIEALHYLQKFRQGYTLRDIDATKTDANKTLDALIQRMQGLTSRAVNVKGLG